MKRLLCLLLLFSILISCTDPGKNQLQIAQSYLNTYPDSTLIYLEDIDPSGLSSKVYMEYLLTMTQARHKTGEDISNNTLLFAYKDQFRKFPDHKAAWFYFYIGKIYSLQGNTNQALCEYMECEKLLTDDIYLTGMLKASYAEAYMDKLELDESISFFQQAAENFEDIQLYSNASSCYNQIGNCYLANNKLDSAFFYYDKCFKYQRYWKPAQEAAMLINLAQAHSISGQNHIAAEHLEQALQLPLNNNEKAIVYGHLAKLHISEPEIFLFYMKQGIDMLPEEETNPLLLSRFYSELSQFYANNNDTRAALDYQLQYNKYLVSAIRTGYDTTIKELRQENHIRHLHSENLQLIVKRQRSQQFFLTVCFVAITIIFIISRQFKRKKQKLMEAEQKIETLQDMVSQDNQEKNSLRNIVLQHFNLIKKVAQLQAISSTKNYSKTIVEKFNHIVYEKESIDWNILYSTINTVHNNLCDKIRNTFTDLKDNEFKVICLTIAKFSNPEIAVILNKSPHTIPGIKSQIRKKLGIIEQGNIANFCLQYWREEKNTDQQN